MAGGMSSQKSGGLLPSGQRFSPFGIHAEGIPEVVQHPVRVHNLQILQISSHILGKDGVVAVQADVAEVELCGNCGRSLRYSVGYMNGRHNLNVIVNQCSGNLHSSLRGGEIRHIKICGPYHFYFSGGVVLICNLQFSRQRRQRVNGSLHFHVLHFHNVQFLVNRNHRGGKLFLHGHRIVRYRSGQGNVHRIAYRACHSSVRSNYLRIRADPADGRSALSRCGEHQILAYRSQPRQFQGFRVSGHDFIGGQLLFYRNLKFLGITRLPGGDGSGQSNHRVSAAGGRSGHRTVGGDHRFIAGCPGDVGTRGSRGGQSQILDDCAQVSQIQPCFVFGNFFVIRNIEFLSNLLRCHGVVVDFEIRNPAVHDVVLKLSVADEGVVRVLQDGQIRVRLFCSDEDAVLIEGHFLLGAVKGDGGEDPFSCLQGLLLLRSLLVAPSGIGDGGSVSHMTRVGAVSDQVHIGSGVKVSVILLEAEIPDSLVAAAGNVQIHPAADGHVLQAVEDACGQFYIGVGVAGSAALEIIGGVIRSVNIHILGGYLGSCRADYAGVAVSAHVIDNGSGLQGLKVIPEYQSVLLCLRSRSVLLCRHNTLHRQ